LRKPRRTKRERREDIKELCRYLEGGGIDTSDILWILEDHERLCENKAQWIKIANANRKRKEMKNSNNNC